jgi:hypothetical protein
LAELGALTLARNSAARSLELDEAAAATSWRTSCTSRVAGLVRSSLVTAIAVGGEGASQRVLREGQTRVGVYLLSAIQPVAMIPHLTEYGVDDAMAVV